MAVFDFTSGDCLLFLFRLVESVCGVVDSVVVCSCVYERKKSMLIVTYVWCDNYYIGIQEVHEYLQYCI